MRILHTSDWHLGQNFYGKSRANEHQQFLTWLLEQAKTHQVDCIIVAGDIFDIGTPPSYAREMYFDFVVNIHKLKCQLIILAGNHDSVAMLGESKQLLNSLSVKVIPHAISSDTPNETDKENSEQVFAIKNDNNDNLAVICAVPFIRPRDILKSNAGESATTKNQALQQSIKDHYDSLYQQAKKIAEQDPNNRLPIIATGHLTTVGVSVSESVRDIYIGTLEAFPANAFPPADYIALGHIHKAQKVAKTQHIRYCGSPIPLSFDEAKRGKSILLADFKEDALEKVTDINIPCFQPIAMIKTELESLFEAVNAEISAHNLSNTQKLWLDIEIQNSGYLQDLQKRIEQLTQDLPVEILLVRRCKEVRQSMVNQQKQITLNELTLDEVFDARLAQEQWDSADANDRKQRLTTLFKQAVSDVNNVKEDSVKEASIKSNDEVIVKTETQK